MPTLLTPPDLQLILDWNDKPVLLQGRALTVFTSRAPEPVVASELVTRMSTEKVVDITLLNGRGYTLVDYVIIEEGVTLAVGVSYLSADDIYSEHIGMALALGRAATNLIRVWRPKNAGDIEKRLIRWADKIFDDFGTNFDWISVDRSTTHAVDRVWDEFKAEVLKCQK